MLLAVVLCGVVCVTLLRPKITISDSSVCHRRALPQSIPTLLACPAFILQLHTQFIVDSTGKCLSQPERGNINDRIPDLRRVTFMQVRNQPTNDCRQGVRGLCVGEV